VQQVLKLWQGLGYYSRARNLHKTAGIITAEYGGIFPQDYYRLLRLPGIGEYTAGAIMSLAFDQPFPAIDGNVYRVLSRFYGIETPIDSSRGKKEFYQLALEIIDRKNPGRHNQAMIELGALVCHPGKPHCTECPLRVSCFACMKNRISELPEKKKQIPLVHRYFYYLVIRKRNAVFIKQRAENDIWALLYDFPLIEKENPFSLPEDLFGSDEWQKLFAGRDLVIRKISSEVKHQLSHQTIHAWFIEISVDEKFSMNFANEVDSSDLEGYPLPRLVDKYLLQE
jgi:A/G-specific adenine glycosylase